MKLLNKPIPGYLNRLADIGNTFSCLVPPLLNNQTSNQTNSTNSNAINDGDARFSGKAYRLTGRHHHFINARFTDHIHLWSRFLMNHYCMESQQQYMDEEWLWRHLYSRIYYSCILISFDQLICVWYFDSQTILNKKLITKYSIVSVWWSRRFHISELF
jgi:hypothetical protein